jgi:tubulin polyglutamylase TTLL1/tubulin monoglycylase TTLL3/8
MHKTVKSSLPTPSNTKRTQTTTARCTPSSILSSDSSPFAHKSKALSLFKVKPKIKSAMLALASATNSLFRSDLPRLLNSSVNDSGNSRVHSKIQAKISKTCKKSGRSSLACSGSDQLSIKEACRIKEWAAKAKPEIERLWRKTVSVLHALEPFNVVFASYKVFIGKGNNAKLVKKIILSRNWWQEVDSKESANFIWTQWKDKQVLEKFKSPAYHPIITLKEENDIFPLVCSLKAQIATRVYKNVDLESLGLNLIKDSSSFQSLKGEKMHPEHQKLHNRLEFNECLSNKKDLLSTMNLYYKTLNKNIFEKLPLSFSVINDSDPIFKDFLKIHSKLEKRKQFKTSFKNIWIVKPGEYTNRGQGIQVCRSLPEIISILKSESSKSYILQKYIEKPLLFHKRKFDIRCYSLMSSLNGVLVGYFYLDGYLRTASSEYSTKDTQNLFVHLTNDAVQKNCLEYGKFENGNKLSYKELQKYLDSAFPEKHVNFFTGVLPLIKNIVKDSMVAASLSIDNGKKMHAFEIFGYDFMIDHKFRPWLIEVNTNPCFELSSPYLASLIPAMIDNAFKLSLDCVFPPPLGQSLESCPVNRFELIFHEDVEGRRYKQLLGLTEV